MTTLNLGTLNAIIDGDDKGFRNAIDRSEKAMAGFQRDANGRLRDMKGHFVKEGDALGRGLGEGIQKRAAEGVDGIYRDAQGKLRTAKGRFIKEGTILGEGIGDGIHDGSKKGLRGLSVDLDVVREHMDKVSKKTGGLRGILSGLGKVTAFTGLASGAAGLASALGPAVTAAGALVIAAGAAGAAIPAFAAGGAAAVGTLKIGFLGLGEAIAGDEEALQKLPPAAREIVSAVKGLAPAWDKVTRSVQEKLWTGLADDFTAIAGKILPRLESGLGGIASAFNLVGKNALDALDSKEVLGGLDKALKATKDGITAFAAGVKPGLEGVGLLIGAFSPLLVDAGEAAASLAQRFRDWVGEAIASGQINDMIATLKDTLSTLGGIVQNLGSIFGSVFSAANEQGGGLLGVIENLTGRLAEFFDSAKGQEALSGFFSALSAVADAVVPIILELASAFGEDLAPHIATIAKEVGPSLRDLVHELGDAIGGIDVATLADGFADVLEAVIPLIEPIANIIGWFSQIEGLVPVLVVALTAWTVAQWALNAAMYANPILLIITLIAALIAGIILLIVNWDAVTEAIAVNLQFTWDKVQEIWNAIYNFLIGIGEAIVGYLKGVWTAISNNVTGVWNAITAFISSKVNQVLSIISWFGSLAGKVAAWFGSVKDAAVDKLTSLVDWVKGIPDRIMSALGSLGSLLKDAGRDLLQGLIDGIESMWNSVQDKLSSLTNSLPDWKGPAERDRTILGPAGEMVIGGFVDGLERAIPTVQRALAGLTNEIGLQVDGSAGVTRVEATTSLSEEDRQLLRELAEARNLLNISTDANTRVKEIRRDAMVVG